MEYRSVDTKRQMNKMKKKNENEIQSSSVSNYKQIPNWNVTQI